MPIDPTTGRPAGFDPTRVKRTPNPMPTVDYDGQTYKLRSRKTEVPDLASMDRMAALVWLNQNTTKRGYSRATNPLAGLGDAIQLDIR